MNIALFRKGEDKPFQMLTGKELVIGFAELVAQTDTGAYTDEPDSVLYSNLLREFLATYEEEPKPESV